VKFTLRALATPCAFALCASILRVLLLRAPARFAIDLAQPLAVVTNWGAFGMLALAVLCAAIAIAFLSYVTLVREAADASVAQIVALSALGVLCAWLVPVLFSSDAYAYAAYGEMASRGIDPYVRAVLPAGDPLFGAAIWQWSNPLPACVYGVLFVALAAAVVHPLHALGVTVQLDGLRLVAGIAFLACTAFAAIAYGSQRRLSPAAAVTIGLNPVSIWSVAEGHNDAIALAIVIGGYALVRRGRPAIGAFVSAMGGLVKLPALLGAAAQTSRQCARTTRFAACAGIAVAAIGSLPLLLAAASHPSAANASSPQASLQGALVTLAQFVVPDRTAALVVAAMAALALSLAVVRRAVAALRAGDTQGWILLGIAAWMMVPNPYPWYGIWLSALAALAPLSPSAWVALLLPLAALARYLPDAAGAPGPPDALLLSVVAVLPLVLLVRQAAAPPVRESTGP
jgi:hypothetical protein